jgi:two-component system response regulator HydG
VDRIGSRKPVKIDTRIIATTNQDLEKMIHEKKFREDLYYRLNVVGIIMPPLRDRREDIPLLVNHFLIIYNRENGKTMKEISPEAMDALVKYEWPGNIRELEHVVEKAVVMGDGEIFLPEYLPLNIYAFAQKDQAPETITIDVGTPVEEVERRMLLAALRKTGGDCREAASLLKMTLKAFSSKASKYKVINGECATGNCA